MKNLKIILLFSFVFGLQQVVFAQKWCEPGAEWIMSENYDYMRYHYQKDTIYEGVPCKKIQALRINRDQCKDTVAIENKSIYTYAQNDTVWFYHEDAFYPTYFFNAQVGDTLVVRNLHPEPSNICDSFLIHVVDSIGTTTVFGDTLRFYTLTTYDEISMLSIEKSVIVEKLGAIQGTFFASQGLNNLSFFHSIRPFYDCGTGIYFKHNCIKDSLFSFSVDPNKDCSTCLPMNIEKSNKEVKQTIKIYPNPNNVGVLNVEGIENALFIIYDLTGKRVLDGKLQSQSISINTLKSGFYTLVFEVSGEFKTQKLIINK